jgi:hypothetical protein
MENKIENLIRKIVFTKYPSLTDVSAEDSFKNSPLLSLGSKYTCKITSDRCLSAEEQMEIDSEVKTLFKMISPISVHNQNISCYFDCGKGFEFKHIVGYKH